MYTLPLLSTPMPMREREREGALDVSNRKEVKLGKQIDVACGIALKWVEINLMSIDRRHNNKITNKLEII